MVKQDIFIVVEHIQCQVSEITHILLAAGRQIVEKTGGNLIAVLLSDRSKDLAKDLGADRVLCCDHPALVDFIPDIYLQVLSRLIPENEPRLILFGDTSIGADIAGPLSVRLGYPLVSACRKLTVDDGNVLYYSQICGGKIMVEGKVLETPTLVTMIPGEYKPEAGRILDHPLLDWLPIPDLSSPRMNVKAYIQPEAGDVDITKEEILVSIGRGIQNQENIEIAKDLADSLGGVLVASRPIVDQGWLPTTRLVGKSGIKVKPKMYLALGISGAPEHVEAIGDSEVIVAVNTDPDAPIFHIAKYGTTANLLDLVPVLTEKIQLSR